MIGCVRLRRLTTPMSLKRHSTESRQVATLPTTNRCKVPAARGLKGLTEADRIQKQIIGILKEDEALSRRSVPQARRRRCRHIQMESEVRRDGSPGRQTAEDAGGREQTAEAAANRGHAEQGCAEGPVWEEVVTPAVKRKAVQHLRDAHGMSERRACLALEIRYQTSRADDAAPHQCMRAIAGKALSPIPNAPKAQCASLGCDLIRCSKQPPGPHPCNNRRSDRAVPSLRLSSPACSAQAVGYLQPKERFLPGREAHGQSAPGRQCP